MQNQNDLSAEYMRRPDMIEFLSAFAVGAIIGATATYLLRPEPKRGRARLRSDLAPYAKRLREQTRTMRRGFEVSSDAVAAAAETLGKAGRVLAHDLREEFSGAVRDARGDLSAAWNDQIGQARKILRRGPRLVGRG